jgi:copper chaperone CopZ
MLAAMQTTFQIKGMSCGHCVKAVEAALRKVAEVKDVQVTVGEAVVTTDAPPDEARLRQVIEDAGYDVA